MHKNNLLLLCFCIGISLLTVHWLKSVKTPSVPIKKITSQQFVPAKTRILTSPISQEVSEPSNTIAAVKTVVAKASAETNAEVAEKTSEADEHAKEIAAQEKYMLLGKLREWAAKDPEAALAAAMKLPAGDERNQALTAVCFGLAESDPADAVKTAESLHLDKQSGAVMDNLIQQWASVDSSSAIEWLISQPAGQQRDGYTQRIAYSLSQTDPASAANLVIKQISPGPAQEEAIMTVLNQWGNQNLVAAAAWVKNFSDGPLQTRALNELEGIANRQQSLAQQ